jgi:DNA (cytosine-5)-methyltransferase 1
MNLPVISLFSGGMGLDLGLEDIGFDVRVAVEYDKYAAATIRRNRPSVAVLQDRIENLSTQQILDAANLKVGEAFLVVGGPSCQAFSTAGKRESFTDDRGTLFRHFLRVVREAKPQFFVMENVKGLLSAAIKHRPLNQRGPGYPTLSWQEQLGSAFTIVTREIASLGGYTTFDVLNSVDYGVPQKRERVIFIGSLNGLKINFPAKTHAEIATAQHLGWATLKDALSNLEDTSPEFVNLPPTISKYLPLIPAGENWRSLPKGLQKEAVGEGVYRSWGGRTGFLRRLSWDKPSPALTTSPINKATLFTHPILNRPLTVKEYARIQQFPDDWIFEGPITSKYKQIGNAVPVGLGRVVGQAIINAVDRNELAEIDGLVVCNDSSLVKRLRHRNLTQLNPPEMSGISTPEEIENWYQESRAWLSSIQKPEVDLFEFLK